MNPQRKYRKSIIPESAKRVFAGDIFDVYQWEQELFDGTKMTFEKISRPDTAVVIPVLPDERILLVEDSQPDRETILSAPSGRIEEGETPEETATRELLEETGYKVKELLPFFTFQPHNKIDWFVYTFIGKGCTKIAEPHLDAGEKIVPRIVTFEKLIDLAVNWELREEKFSIMALQAKLDPAKMEDLRQKFFS